MSVVNDSHLPHRIAVNDGLTTNVSSDPSPFESILASQALARWDNIRDDSLQQDICLPPKKLYFLLFASRPLSFSQFVRVQSLNKQKKLYLLDLQTFQQLLAQRCNDIIARLEPQQTTAVAQSKPSVISSSDIALALHSFQHTSHLPALSLLFAAYLQYLPYATIDSPHTQSSGEFSRTLPRVLDRLLKPGRVTPTWLLVTHIPIAATVQGIRATIIQGGDGYVRHILLPIEPTSCTRGVFVEFASQIARDQAVEKLNKMTVTWGIGTQQQQQQQQQQQSSSQHKKHPKQQNNNVSSLPPVLYRVRATPWYSTAQFKHDTDALQLSSQSFSGSRHPVFPVGPKQWLTGPLPQQTIFSRFEKDILQLRLLIVFFDSVHSIQVQRNFTSISSQFISMLPEAAPYLQTPLSSLLPAVKAAQNKDGSSSILAPSDVIDSSERRTVLLLIVRLLTMYLRHVHFYDYWTNTLYPTFSAIQSDIGEDWTIVDLPAETPLQRRAFLKSLINDISALRQNSSSTVDSSINNTVKSSSGNTTTPPPVVIPTVETFPLDSSFAPSQLAITAYYNAILAMSPNPRWQPCGSLNNTITGTVATHQSSLTTTNSSSHVVVYPLVPFNFWHLAPLYANQFVSQRNISPMVAVRRSIIYALAPPPIDSTSSTTMSDHSELPPAAQLITTGNTQYGHGFVPSQMRASTEAFWLAIDSTTQQVSEVFDPATINPYVLTSRETLDPDLFLVCNRLRANSLSTSSHLRFQLLDNLRQTLTNVVSVSRYVERAARDRFVCRLCDKKFLSIATVLQHLERHPETNHDEDFDHARLFQLYQLDPDALNLQPAELTSGVHEFLLHSSPYGPEATAAATNDVSRPADKTQQKQTKQQPAPHVYDMDSLRAASTMNQHIDRAWARVLDQYETASILHKKAVETDMTKLKHKLDRLNQLKPQAGHVPTTEKAKKRHETLEMLSRKNAAQTPNPHFSDNDNFGTRYVPPTLDWSEIDNYETNPAAFLPLSQVYSQKFHSDVNGLIFTDDSQPTDQSMDEIKSDEEKRSHQQSSYAFASYLNKTHTQNQMSTLTPVQKQHRAICEHLILLYGKDDVLLANPGPEPVCYQFQKAPLPISTTAPVFDPFVNL